MQGRKKVEKSRLHTVTFRDTIHYVEEGFVFYSTEEDGIMKQKTCGQRANEGCQRVQSSPLRTFYYFRA